MRTMYRKVKNIKEFGSLFLASLSSPELSIVGSYVESALYVEARKSEPKESKVRHMCLFIEGDQQRNKNPPQFGPILSKNNTTTLQHLPQFYKVSTVFI